MRKLLFIIGFCFLNIMNVSASCMTPSNNVFNDGEMIKYKVFYNVSAAWIGAGEATFTTHSKTYNNNPVYHIVGVGNTYKSYDWIFKVRDRYETYIDRNTFLPHRFIRNVNEGGYSFKNDVSFSQSARKAVSNRKSYAIKECTQDVLSTIYFARNINYNQYKSGEKIPFSLFLDDKIYDIYIKYLGKTTVKTQYGTFKAIKIVPLLIKGTIFKGGESMVVYVTDDLNRIPVRIETSILVGSIKVDLMAFKNLKYPLTAKIK